MFSFFKKKSPSAPTAEAPAPVVNHDPEGPLALEEKALEPVAVVINVAETNESATRQGWIAKLRSGLAPAPAPAPAEVLRHEVLAPPVEKAPQLPAPPVHEAPAQEPPPPKKELTEEAPRPGWIAKLRSGLTPASDAVKSEPQLPVVKTTQPPIAAAVEAPVQDATSLEKQTADDAPRPGWMAKLRSGLQKTGTSIARVFVGAKIDDELYEELESAMLMADAGVQATEYLMQDLKRRVKDNGSTEATQVKQLLIQALTDLLLPLERTLVIGQHEPDVIMVVGVNGAGKTTSIGKLTRHLAEGGANVLLAAADTFRAAAREQLQIWAGRNQVEIISQEGGDPSSVVFDAVSAARARGSDVVLADTAGRLPTQLHLMEELKKMKRVIGKAQPDAPHEVLLVIDGNTGQNALAQVKSFNEALGLTGLIVTKLDGTAKGGVLAAIALWARDQKKTSPSIAVYFIGVGEKLEDLQTFRAEEFAQALVG
jgi:fused signal recognition particle receptor